MSVLRLRELSLMTTFVLPCAAIPLPDKLPDAYLQFIRHAHTGLPIPAGFTETGMCATFDQGISDPADGIARGYITVDNVKTCSTATATSGANLLRRPPSPRTVLLPTCSGVTTSWSIRPATSLRAIRWCTSRPTAMWTGSYTFYGRYLASTGARMDAQLHSCGEDSREALPTTWAYRYSEEDAGPFTEGTDVLCWRDSAEREPPMMNGGGPRGGGRSGPT